MVLAAAAFDLDAVDLADEVDHQGVALLCLARFGDRRVALGVRRHAFERPIDIRVARLGGVAGELEVLEITGRNLRHHLHGHGVLEVVTLGGLGDLDPRLHRRAHRLLGERLGRGLIERLFDDFVAERFAVALAQQLGRRLARPEPGDAGGLAQVFEAVLDPRFDVLRVDDHLELALEPVGFGLNDFHRALDLRVSRTQADVCFRGRDGHRGAGPGESSKRCLRAPRRPCVARGFTRFRGQRQTICGDRTTQSGGVGVVVMCPGAPYRKHPPAARATRGRGRSTPRRVSEKPSPRRKLRYRRQRPRAE